MKNWSFLFLIGTILIITISGCKKEDEETGVPKAPSSLNATPSSSVEIDLSWTDNSNNETGFRIERSPNNSTWTEIGTVAAGKTTYQNTGLTASTTYYYRVRAYNNAGNSPYTTSVSARTLAPASLGPAAPSNLTAAAASVTQINLSWTDNSGDETGFKIEKSADGSTGWTEIATVSANSTAYQNTGLTAGTTHYYRVRAYNASGNSSYSNIANATTASANAPNAPSNLTASAASTSQINLSWTDNSNNETGFRIERSPDNSTWAEITTVSANVTTYQNTGLTASTTYYYRVRAYNATGNSGYSNTANAATQGTVPAAPSTLTASAASASQINLSWTDNSSNETGFRIERSPDNSTWAEITTVSANVTTYQNTGLAASTTYYYRVRAYNATGNSGYSNTANAATQGTAPAAPSNPTATAVSSSQINLTWTDNSNNETGFRIERSPDNSAWAEITTVSANVTTYQNTGLAASTIYYYRVRAYNAAGNSAYTTTVSATTFTAVPAPPTNLTATATSSSQINLSWTDNANNETNYKVERAPGGTTDFAEIASLAANVTTYSNTSLGASTSYTYRVKATNSGGSSAYSNQATATTFSAETIPTISGPSTSTGTFTLTMTYPFGGYLGSTSDGYYLEESTTSPTSGFTQIQSWTNTRVTSKTYTLTKSSGTYYYRVRVYNLNSFSPYSSVIAVAVNATPPKATLHITNNTKYFMIDIRLNGTQYVTTAGTGLDVGNSYNVEFTSSGSVTYYLGVGLWEGSTRNVWFYLSGTTSVTVGSTTNLTFNNPTIAQILSGFSSSRNWNGYYYDANYNYHTCRFNFTSSGTWTLYDGSTQIGSGSVTLVTWANYAAIITFKVCSTCADIQLAYPFGSFMYRNGPASWPVIEYTAQ